MSGKKSSMKSLMAYEKIRDMILKGQKLPGSRLVIADLEKEMGIGKGAIRDAMMRLDRSGLVRNVPYKGAEVAKPPSPEEILYIYKVRLELESKLAVAALDHITDSDVDELERLHNIMMEMPTEHYLYDVDFHSYIYQIANLPHVFNIVKVCISSAESVLNIFRRDKEYMAEANSQHYEIINAIKSKNSDKVKDTMTQNIEKGLSIIRKTYNELINQPFE